MKKLSFVAHASVVVSAPRFLLGLACFVLEMLLVFYWQPAPEIPLAFLVAGLLALYPSLWSMGYLVRLLWLVSFFLFSTMLLLYLLLRVW